MKTDVISIDDELHGQSSAMQEAEHFTEYFYLTGRNAMHIRLLTEEAISLVHGIIPNFNGRFWLESEQTEDGILCRICVTADVDVSDGQEKKLLAVSTSGKNEDAKGIMGKIRQILRWSIQHTDDEQIVKQSWYERGCNRADSSSSTSVDYYWSLANYRDQVKEQLDSDADELEELEKSIIAKLSDEVKVGIRSNVAEVIIEKRFPNVK